MFIPKVTYLRQVVSIFKISAGVAPAVIAALTCAARPSTMGLPTAPPGMWRWVVTRSPTPAM